MNMNGMSFFKFSEVNMPSKKRRILTITSILYERIAEILVGTLLQQIDSNCSSIYIRAYGLKSQAKWLSIFES